MRFYFNEGCCDSFCFPYCLCFSTYPASFTVLFEPSATVSLETYCTTRDYLVLETLDTVKSRYIFWRFEEPAGTTSVTGSAKKAGEWAQCGAEPSKCYFFIVLLRCLVVGAVCDLLSSSMICICEISNYLQLIKS